MAQAMNNEPTLSAKLIEHHLSRIEASAVFRNSARLRKLLCHTVKKAQQGHCQELKESVLGVVVFGRPPGFDSDAHSIVRVEFARLRKKLEEYYRTEGMCDALRITYPKGTYIPQFDLCPESQPGSGERFNLGSLAVLPLVSRGSDDDESFADGLTDELITSLSRVSGLKVVARTSSFAFRNQTTDIREIGRVLNVSTVLEGTVRRNRDVVRVHVQLAAVKDGCQLWAQKYERRLTDIFAVQDEIADAILKALRIELPRTAPLHKPQRPGQIAAYELYLKGRYWWPRWNPGALRHAAAFFEQALDIDPTYAAAHSGLADCLFLQGFYGYGRPRTTMAAAEANARKALELDPMLAEAYCSLGMIENSWNWNTDACRTAFERCLALNPGYALAKAKFGTSYLTPLARFDEAFDCILQALELDPLSPSAHADLALNYNFRSLHEEFIAQAARVHDMASDVSLKIYPFEVTSHGVRGDWTSAIAAAERTMNAAPEHSYSLAIAVWALANGGYHDRARAIRDALHDMSRTRYVPPTALAVAYADGSESDLVFRYIEEGLEERDALLRYINISVPLARFRSDARYHRLLQKVGLAEQPLL
jgi:serine/threonine-protein kinase